MTVLIGITQAPKETETKIFNEFKEIGTSAVVGPFITPDQAADWMKFMMARSGNYKHIPVTSSSSEKQAWYGFTFEWVEANTHLTQPVLECSMS